MGDIIRLNDIEALLQIHASAESLVASTCEDSASQLRLRIVPFPKRA